MRSFPSPFALDLDQDDPANVHVFGRLIGWTEKSHAHLKILLQAAFAFLSTSQSISNTPQNESWFFSVDEGVGNPTGGLYSTSSDLSLYLRYILTHYNGLHTGSNWLQPASFSTGSSSYYGMPWEIYRALNLLPLRSVPVTFFTKGGGVPGYVSIIAIAPEYDLGITILVGGNTTLLPKLLEAVSVPLIEAADEVAGLELEDRYTGTYIATDLNSTLTLAYTPTKRLYIDRWISNGTDFLATLSQIFPGTMDDGGWLQVVPTLLYVDEERQVGERWRALPVPVEQKERKEVWDDFCITYMYDVAYDGRPLNEVVFWDDEVELTAFRIRLGKVKGVEEEVGKRFVVQQF